MRYSSIVYWTEDEIGDRGPNLHKKQFVEANKCFIWYGPYKIPFKSINHFSVSICFITKRVLLEIDVMTVASRM
jgi:hypothetical protein